jgi:hypothetical protein
MIPEIKKFRDKYPQYNDIDDYTLANKLATKDKQYSDLPVRVKDEESQTAQRISSDAPDITTPVQPKPLEFLQQETKPEDMSKGESFLAGGAKMASAGFAPEISGYIKSKLQPSLIGAETKDYIRAEKDRMKLAEEGNPKMFMAGEFAGSVPSMLLIPGGGSSATQAKNIGTIVKMLKASKGFITPAVEGAIVSAGYSDKEDFKGRMKDAGYGALFGVASHGVGKVAGKLLPSKQKFLDLGRKFKDKAETKVLDAMGLFGKKRAKHLFDTKSMRQLVKDKLMARQILDDKNIKLLDSTKKVFQKAIRESEKQGQKIGNFYAKMDSLGKNTLDARKLATELYEDISKEFGGRMDRTKLNAMTKALDDMFDLPVDSSGKTTFRAVQDFKRKLDSKIKKWGIPDERYEGYKTAREKLRKALVKGSVDAGAEPRELVKLNMKFKNLANVDDLASIVGNKNLAKDIQETLNLNPWSVNYVANNAALTAATKGVGLLDKLRRGRYSSAVAVISDFFSKTNFDIAKNKKLWKIVGGLSKMQDSGQVAPIHALLYAKSKPYREKFKAFFEEVKDSKDQKTKAYNSVVF